MIEFPSLPPGSRTNIEFNSEVLRMVANREALILGGNDKKKSPIHGLNELSLEKLKELLTYSRYIPDEEITGIMNTKDFTKGELKIIEAI